MVDVVFDLRQNCFRPFRSNQFSHLIAFATFVNIILAKHFDNIIETTLSKLITNTLCVKSTEKWGTTLYTTYIHVIFIHRHLQSHNFTHTNHYLPKNFLKCRICTNYLEQKTLDDWLRSIAHWSTCPDMSIVHWHVTCPYMSTDLIGSYCILDVMSDSRGMTLP